MVAVSGEWKAVGLLSIICVVLRCHQKTASVIAEDHAGRAPPTCQKQCMNFI